MTEDELDMIDTEEIFKALQRRFAAVVLCVLEDLDSEREEARVFWSGGKYQALGLATDAVDRIKAVIVQSLQE